MAKGIEVLSKPPAGADEILSAEALAFIERLHNQLEPTRQSLLASRRKRQQQLDGGDALDFLPETKSIRAGDWTVAPAPQDLLKRWVEITGPVERKMMINALNSSASVFMADFEDSLSPTWANVLLGQVNLIDAIRGTITFENPDGRVYRLAPRTATLLVRPRGWHLLESHVRVDGRPVSASLFDFGLFAF